MYKIISIISVSLLSLTISNLSFAAAYHLPRSSESLIGDIEYSRIHVGDSATTIAEKYNIGYNSIQNANPQLDLDKILPEGADLLVPTQHILPNQGRRGVVINLPEMRMYYYPENSREVLTYPIGIGKIGKTIPIKRAVVTRKKENPTWVPPKDIREYNLRKGIVLPRIMPPGPDNPLGNYAIYMSIPTFLMHSTIYPESIGRRASFGCIRMYESDIEDLFPAISTGTPITIINNPIKFGWQNKELYMEAHHPLEEFHDGISALPEIIKEVANETNNEATLVDWQGVYYLSKERDGVPHDIGIKIPA